MNPLSYAGPGSVKDTDMDEFSHKKHTDQVCGDHAVCDVISALIFQRVQFGTAIAAMISAGFHSHRQIVGASECGDEQRNQDRDHALCTFDHAAALEVRAAGLLRLHDLIGLLHENGDETQSDGHHHRDFMHRDMQLFQAAESSLHTLRQVVGSGGEGHDGGSEYKEDQTDGHITCHPESFLGNGQFPYLSERLSRSQEKVEDHSDHHKDHDGFQSSHHITEGNLGQFDHGDQEDGRYQVRTDGTEYEQRDDEQYRSKQFHSRVQFMQGRFRRIILAQCYVFKHV